VRNSVPCWKVKYAGVLRQCTAMWVALVAAVDLLPPCLLIDMDGRIDYVWVLGLDVRVPVLPGRPSACFSCHVLSAALLHCCCDAGMQLHGRRSDAFLFCTCCCNVCMCSIGYGQAQGCVPSIEHEHRCNDSISVVAWGHV
jgi:hypothetical protein